MTANVTIMPPGADIFASGCDVMRDLIARRCAIFRRTDTGAQFAITKLGLVALRLPR